MKTEKPEKRPYVNAAGMSVSGFEETTLREFHAHMYGNTTRCRLQDRILSFFSSEKEASGLHLFFFSHRGRYYRAFRDRNLTDAALDREMMNFLYPDSKSFFYRGWLCRFSREDSLYYLFTPCEQEQPSAIQCSEMEASHPRRQWNL
jgi:hypothetical protein